MKICTPELGLPCLSIALVHHEANALPFLHAALVFKNKTDPCLNSG